MYYESNVQFCAHAQLKKKKVKIHIKTHVCASSGYRQRDITTVFESKRLNIPNPFYADLVSLHCDAGAQEEEDSEAATHPLPKELDKDTVTSWIVCINKSTRERDIRAVKLVHDRLRALNVSSVYPPLYHALMFGYGRLGDIRCMLQLYRTLLREHEQHSTPQRVIVSARIMTTLLSCLSLFNRNQEAFSIFDAYLQLAHVRPDIHNFCVIMKHCSRAQEWSRCQSYFHSMVHVHGIAANDYVFRFMLEVCAYCRPPKYEEAWSMLQRMRSDYELAPNAQHVSIVIHTLATPYAFTRNAAAQDLALHVENFGDFAAYKQKVLHLRLFDSVLQQRSAHRLSDSDLQRCLNVFHEYVDEHGMLPNDRLFAQIFYACDKARDLDMALKFRTYWKRKFPHIRQQSYSFNKLLAICCSVASWDDALQIYRHTALFDDDDNDDDGKNDAGNDDGTPPPSSSSSSLYSLDGDALSCEAYHKVLPTSDVLNSLLRCAKCDISRQLYDGLIDSEQAEHELLRRIHYVQSQMYHFNVSPTQKTWILLFQCAATLRSKRLCNRFLTRFFQCHAKNYHKKQKMHFTNYGEHEQWYNDAIVKRIPDAWRTNGNPNATHEEEEETWHDCWDLYDAHTFECDQAMFQHILSMLYWSDQTERALEFYHDIYGKKGLYPHWLSTRGTPTEDAQIMLDFHSFDPAVCVVALLYVFRYEFEHIYHEFLTKKDPLSEVMATSDQIEIELPMDETVSVDRASETRKATDLAVMTGVGKNNHAGIALLRPWIVAWLSNECQPAIKSYVHPRNHGILYLDSTDILNWIRANMAN